MMIVVVVPTHTLLKCFSFSQVFDFIHYRLVSNRCKFYSKRCEPVETELGWLQALHISSWSVLILRGYFGMNIHFQKNPTPTNAAPIRRPVRKSSWVRLTLKNIWMSWRQPYRRCWTRNLHRWHRCHCCHRRCLTGDQLSPHWSSLMQIWASPVVGWFRPTSSRSRKCWPDTWASPGCHEASRSGWNSGETTVPVFGCHQQRGETTVSRLRWPALRWCTMRAAWKD